MNGCAFRRLSDRGSTLASHEYMPTGTSFCDCPRFLGSTLDDDDDDEVPRERGLVLSRGRSLFLGITRASREYIFRGRTLDDDDDDDDDEVTRGCGLILPRGRSRFLGITLDDDDDEVPRECGLVVPRGRSRVGRDSSESDSDDKADMNDRIRLSSVLRFLLVLIRDRTLDDDDDEVPRECGLILPRGRSRVGRDSSESDSDDKADMNDRIRLSSGLRFLLVLIRDRTLDDDDDDDDDGASGEATSRGRSCRVRISHPLVVNTAICRSFLLGLICDRTRGIALLSIGAPPPIWVSPRFISENCT